MIRAFRRATMLAAAAFCLCVLPGCVTGLVVGTVAVVAGGTGAYAYIRGNYIGNLAGPLFHADKAVRQVAARARFVETKRECSGYKAEYTYLDDQDIKVYIRLEAKSAESTKCLIRVGAFGDKEISAELMAAIDEQMQAYMK
ncbi:MAG: DUF3568 family protein [Lentisphaeria bacterium]|nr:DUF3568 family protein [Lentisphaeria bacterium]